MAGGREEKRSIDSYHLTVISCHIIRAGTAQKAIDN
jgi:hypothetical protein